MNASTRLLLAVALVFGLTSCSESLTGPSADGTPEVASKGKPGAGGGGQAPNPTYSVTIKPVQGGFSETPATTSTVRESYNRYPEDSSADTFFGCPDAYATCNEVTIQVTGGASGDRFSIQGALVATDPSCSAATPTNACLWDSGLGTDAYLGAGDISTAAPGWLWDEMTPNADGTRSHVFHWQGQRASWTRADDPSSGQKIREWYVLPDQAGPVYPDSGDDDYFVFDIVCDPGQSSLLYSRIRTTYARSDGDVVSDAFLHAWVTATNGSVQTKGKGRNMTTVVVPPTVDIDYSAFTSAVGASTDFTSEAVVHSNRTPHMRVLLIDPAGNRSFLRAVRLGENELDVLKPRIDVSGFRAELKAGDGLYEIRVIAALVEDERYFAPGVRYAWDGDSARRTCFRVTGDSVSDSACE